ncbi:cupredoxin domain-containing protein [Patulibacter americanus]|uniref:cupredoxin domain-containing protein n=1 Tax=Patulibacter americanus TaxID=588672 RepID=UPI0004034520|nr:plastocyanin/azurin family copper-binding protein [Patulibacter americanus]
MRIRTPTMTAAAVAVVATAVVGVAISTPTPAPAAGTRTVDVKDFAFAPKTITVRRGTTVKFVWRGKVFHDVTVVSGPSSFASEAKRRGSWSKRLTRKGTYRLQCSLHAMLMRMTIRVV